MSEKTIIYKFLDVEVDVQLRELRRANQVVSLQPKIFNLLVYLLENRTRAVTKDELQDSVWSGTIVSETALSRAIMKARKAVGDDAEQKKILVRDFLRCLWLRTQRRFGLVTNWH